MHNVTEYFPINVARLVVSPIFTESALGLSYRFDDGV